jgi:hypothetical protein
MRNLLLRLCSRLRPKFGPAALDFTQNPVFAPTQRYPRLRFDPLHDLAGVPPLLDKPRGDFAKPFTVVAGAIAIEGLVVYMHDILPFGSLIFVGSSRVCACCCTKQISPFQSETGQDSRRRVGEPGKLFAVDDLAAQHLTLQSFALDDHGRGLANGRALRFSQACRAAEVVGERDCEVAISPCGGGPSVDVRK